MFESGNCAIWRSADESRCYGALGRATPPATPRTSPASEPREPRWRYRAPAPRRSESLGVRQERACGGVRDAKRFDQRSAPGRIRTCDLWLRRPWVRVSPGRPKTISPDFTPCSAGGRQLLPTPDRDGVSHQCHTTAVHAAFVMWAIKRAARSLPEREHDLAPRSRAMRAPFRRQNAKDTAHQLQRLSPTGFCGAQHDDADVLTGRVCPDVCEVEVESEKDAPLGLAPRCNYRIVRARESFVMDRIARPTGLRRSSAASTGRFSSSFARIRRSYAGRGRTRSWARSAAYANAA